MKKLALSIFAISNILLFSSCEEDAKIEDQHPHLTLSVEHKVDAQDLEFDTIKYVNSVGHKYEVQTLKYFISNVELHKAGGSKTTLKGPFYIDAEDPTTFTLDDQVDIPTGTYEKISLIFGLDSTANISNTLTSIEAIGMNWPDPMGGGYHYMKLEGSYDSLQLNIPKNYAVHTGASMGDPYHINLELPNSNFTVSTEDISIKIQMNVNEWFTDPNNYDFAAYPSMIMVNMQAQMALKANGNSVFTAIIN
tara:strand:- start:2514 stop:3263 length:750 start_codon:yes stop_codon:yes gene_type:complete